MGTSDTYVSIIGSQTVYHLGCPVGRWDDVLAWRTSDEGLDGRKGSCTSKWRGW